VRRAQGGRGGRRVGSRGWKKRRRRGKKKSAGGDERASVFTLCRIPRMRTGLYRKGCARALDGVHPPAFPSLPSILPPRPRGPRTNNCRPVNSRYDTREERYTFSSAGDRRRSPWLPRYKNEIRRCAEVAASEKKTTPPA